MKKQIEIRLAPEMLGEIDAQLRKKLKVEADEVLQYRVIRRSLDARHGNPKFQLLCEVAIGEPLEEVAPFAMRLRDVRNAPPVIIVGFGPAGMFAALRLIELGLKPLVLERGKDVRARRRDIANVTKRGFVDPDSNYCFGEGGAGTFSDGKLYTRSTKRGSVERILEILVMHGADPSILVEAHPHVGTNKLPSVVQNIRQQVIEHGGEVCFEKRVVGLLTASGRCEGVILASGERVQAKAVLVASGHSARDVYQFLHASGVKLEAKPFALGVRAEHPQRLIDEVQYRSARYSDILPPASYTLQHQVGTRGVFSFCMCPGGIICPAATAPGEIVTNGWSPSKRNSRFANSGIVQQVKLEDWQPYPGDEVFRGLELQKSIERQAFLVAGGIGQKAPAQRLVDFVEGRVSSTLPDCSYIPGVVSADLCEVFPKTYSDTLREGFLGFGKKMKGYFTNEALLVATESRTSSPVRIVRETETGMSPTCEGLFPCGEGGGFAGGIVSAAMDGEWSAERVCSFLQTKPK